MYYKLAVHVHQIHVLQAKRWDASCDNFLAGQQLTHVDLALFTTLSTLRSGWMPGGHLLRPGNCFVYMCNM
jgi:hypothetical protein